MALVHDKLFQNIKHFLPYNRVETACRFVENQQPCIVGKCDGQGKLYLHSSGIFFNFLFAVYMKLFQILIKAITVPVPVYPPHHAVHFHRLKQIWKIQSFHDYSDVLPQPGIILAYVFTEHPDRSPVPVD